VSDAYGSYGNPYGVPPPYPHQIPQGPPGPPPGSGPPGGPPGQPPGLPPMPPPQGIQEEPWYVPREPRPGVVVAGAIIAFVLTGLSIAFVLLMVVGVVVAHTDPDPDAHLTRGEMVAALVVCGIALACCVAGIVFAALALARRQWARITTVVLGFCAAAVIAFVGVCLIVDGASSSGDSAGEVVSGAVVIVLGLVAVVSAVLLLLPPAARWYAGRHAAR
jgi:hypothetical protein